jgi:cell division initiation protein
VTLDKIDLLDRTFSHSLVGYRRDEVDRLVAEAADSIGRLAEEKMALARANEILTREIGEYRAREATLRDTLLTTQQIVEDLKGKARQEAGRIVGEARNQAAAIVGEARDKAMALAGEIEALAARKAALIGQFRDLLLAGLDMLDAETASVDVPEALEAGLDGPDAGAGMMVAAAPTADRALEAPLGQEG